MPAITKKQATIVGEETVANLNGTGLNGHSRERLAISLEDLDRMLPEVRQRMLAGKLDLTSILRVGAKSDVPAVAFSCDLLTAATICDIIRSEDRKIGDSSTTVWMLRKAWSRVSGSEVLTVVGPEGVRLNPEAFRVEVEAVAPSAPQFRRV